MTDIANAKQVSLEDDDVLDAAAVAKLLKVNVKLVYLAAANGELPCIKLGRILRFSRAAVIYSLHSGQGRVSSKRG